MKVFCLSIDVVNADKPTASLAFLAGVCEHVNADYECASINAEMLRILNRQQFQSLYDSIKLGTEDRWIPDIRSAMEDLILRIKVFDPDLLLISFFSFMQVNLGRHFLQQLRKHMPTLEILAGGPGINNSGKALCTEGLIDYYVLGEGDEVLPEFLQGNRELLGVNSAKSKFENWVPQVNDLDNKYITPSYKKIDFSVYKNIEAKQHGVVSISTSRGCVRACTFCDVSTIWPKFRFRSGAKIAQEVVQHWQDTGIPNFYISDSLINGSLKSFREFNQAMIELKKQHSGLKEFSYNGMFIVRDRKSHTEEFFKQMADAGCESIAIGVETGSDSLRARMAKKFTNEDLDWHMAMCQKYKIRNVLLMFVAHPEETAEDYQQTLDLLDRYQKYLIGDTIIGINFSGAYTLYPSTPDWEHRDETG
jgi:anaerobic magnesium-protoporphyrin IX monomethyl ester cyclase